MLKRANSAYAIVLLCLALLTRPTAGYSAADNSRCLMCHSAPTISKTVDGKRISLFVHAGAFKASVHSGMTCTDCHTDLAGQPFTHKPDADSVQCGRCHRMAGLPPDGVHFDISEQERPGCKDCHGAHYTRKTDDPESPVHRSNVEGTCAACHGDSARMRAYLASVHGMIQPKTGLPRAVCTDCHRAHTVLAAGTPVTCAGCHEKEWQRYSISSHGKGRQGGDTDAPGCIECHGSHGIRSATQPDSPTYPTEVPRLCGRCHGDPGLQRKYGLPPDSLVTFRHSYHGVALEHGDLSVATCTSCHRAHDIRPAGDPKSSINRRNLPHTCGKCHTGATENYGKGKVHVLARKQDSLLLYYVASGFKWLTIGTMAALIGHILLDLWARVRNRIRRLRAGESA